MSNIPDPPSHIGQRGRGKTINGQRMAYEVIDEIIRVPRSNPKKAIYLQMLKNEPDGRLEMRMCYFMIGAKEGRMKGKWVFAQFAPMIRQKDFEFLINKAREKGWVTC